MLIVMTTHKLIIGGESMLECIRSIASVKNAIASKKKEKKTKKSDKRN